MWEMSEQIAFVRVVFHVSPQSHKIHVHVRSRNLNTLQRVILCKKNEYNFFLNFYFLYIWINAKSSDTFFHYIERTWSGLLKSDKCKWVGVICHTFCVDCRFVCSFRYLINRHFSSHTVNDNGNDGRESRHFDLLVLLESKNFSNSPTLWLIFATTTTKKKQLETSQTAQSIMHIWLSTLVFNNETTHRWTRKLVLNMHHERVKNKIQSIFRFKPFNIYIVPFSIVVFCCSVFCQSEKRENTWESSSVLFSQCDNCKSEIRFLKWRLQQPHRN